MKKIILVLTTVLVALAGCGDSNTVDSVKYEVVGVEKSEKIELPVVIYEGNFMFVTLSITNESDEDVLISPKNIGIVDGENTTGINDMVAAMVALDSDSDDVYFSLEEEIKAGESIEVIALFSVVEQETYDSSDITLKVTGHDSEEEIEVEYEK